MYLPRRPCAAAVESLEPRRLLAGFAATINFQPAEVGPVEFTRADFGRPFAERGNGLTYGWSRDLEDAGAMVDRDSERDLIGLAFGGRPGNGPAGEVDGVDERFDTFAQVEVGDEWRIEVPNGTYAVALVSGDPEFQGGVGTQRHIWTVNGESAMDARPLAAYPWGEAVTFVEVTDGLITLRAGEGSMGGSLSWLRVAEVDPLPQYEEGESIEWEDFSEDAASPVRRIEGGSVRVGDKLYVMGGFGEAYLTTQKRMDILDIPTLTWSPGADLPAEAAETHIAFAGDPARGHIYWLSGQIGTGQNGVSFDVTPSVWRYVISENRWERYVDLPEPRYGAAAAVVGDELFFFGGNDESRVVARGDGWKVDLTQPLVDADGNGIPEGPAWEPIAPMLVAGDHLNADALNGKIYITGSEHAHGTSYVQQREVQIYDPDADEWSLGAPLPVASSHNRSVVHDGRIWVFGGQRETQIVLDDVRSYDPLTDTWKVHDPMRETRKAGYVFIEDDNIYYIAGDAYLGGFPFRAVVGRFVSDVT